MAKLNQIIAVDKGIKSRVYAVATELHKAIQKPELFNGFTKQYQANAEDGEKLPPESKRVQFTVPDVLRTVDRAFTEHFNVEARKDWTNCVAKADVIVDGKVLIPQAPTTFLLFLEKQLNDLRTMVAVLPTLDIADDWTKNPNSGLYQTDVVQTHRTKKVQKPIVLYQATDQHPAQTQLITEDQIAGYWSQVKQSGAIPVPEKAALLSKVDKLLQAVKQAREAANMVEEVQTPDVGSLIFTHLFG